jgi:trehalose 6-phosphate phosphatase
VKSEADLSAPEPGDATLTESTPRPPAEIDHRIDFAASAILLDIDGTILDIAPTPDLVVVPADLRLALARLHEKTGGALALVSGRTLADIEHIFAPLRLPAVGGHGAEIRCAATEMADRHLAAPLDERLRQRLAMLPLLDPRILIEDKGFAVAVHYRLAPERERMVHDAVATICAEWPPASLELLPGKAVIEIKPRAFNKGTAVRELMRHAPFRGRKPIFIGDDVTDHAAFKVLPEFDGIAFSVGLPVPDTDGCFAQPEDVRNWLGRLAGSG